MPQLGLRVICRQTEDVTTGTDCFAVHPCGTVVLRSRQQKDTMRLHGGTKALKKLFIDRKIPASQRGLIPVIADEKGVLGVYGIGANLDTVPKTGPAIQIRFEKL